MEREDSSPRWHDIGEVKANDPAESQSEQMSLYLTNLPISLSKSELLACLPLTVLEQAQVRANFIKFKGRYQGEVEVTGERAAVEKLYQVHRSVIGGNLVIVSDTPREPKLHTNKTPAHRLPVTSGRSHDRKAFRHALPLDAGRLEGQQGPPINEKGRKDKRPKGDVKFI
jgi:hypothetical protein